MKTAITHDWLPLFSGAELVLTEMMAVVGPSDLYTLFEFLTPEDRARIGAARIITSYLDRVPMRQRFYRHLFPFCPQAMESFDLSDYDLVLSSSAAFAKGVIVHPQQRHVAYMHTPPRYAWDQTFEYLARTSLSKGLAGMVLKRALFNLRLWDVRTAHGPDILLANSSVVRRRIEQIYGREALIVHPPVNVDEFPLEATKDDYFVVASRLVPYKRIDLVVEAFRSLPNQRLLVVGDGPELGKLKQIAGPNVEFRGHVGRAELIRTISRARAFLFASYEDFGIVMAEALAAGTPVVAYRRGGAEDIVVPLGEPNPTGMLFDRQEASSIVEAVRSFIARSDEIGAEDCRARAMQFSTPRFHEKLRRVIDATMDRSFRRDRIAGILD